MNDSVNFDVSGLNELVNSLDNFSKADNKKVLRAILKEIISPEQKSIKVWFKQHKRSGYMYKHFSGVRSKNVKRGYYNGNIIVYAYFTGNIEGRKWTKNKDRLMPEPDTIAGWLNYGTSNHFIGKKGNFKVVRGIVGNHLFTNAKDALYNSGTEKISEKFADLFKNQLGKYFDSEIEFD